jgi:ankyrin repeat protein
MTNNQGDVVDGIGGIGGNTDDDDEDEGRYDIYEQDQDGSSSFSLGVDDNDSDSLVPFAHTHHQFTPTLPPTDDNYVDDYYVDETSGQMNMNDDYGNSGRLLAILENAVRVRASQQAQRHHDKNNNNNNSEDFVPTPEELQRKRELLEQTWKEIRTDWLWATETQDDQEERTAAVYCRGTDNLTPLHLICKLTNNPPTDIISEIISAGPEVAGWTDCHMWLPLHHACINGASTEVLTLLTGAYPDGKVSVDVHNRTPLHLYATRGNSDNYNPVTMATNFTILINGGDHGNEYHENNDKNNAAKVRTTNGMLPMHYACAYGTTTSVLKVLEEAYPESINAKDDNGKTPLHMVMVNAQRTASPGVLGFLLNYEYGDDNNDDDDNGYHPDGSNDDTTGIAGASDDTNNNNNINTDGSTREKRSVIIRTNTIGVNVRDYEGNLPLHVLIIGLTGVDFEQNPDKLHNIAECLKLYLASKPYASTDFLAALQSLPDSLQDVAVVTPHVRNILNKKIVERFPTSILVSVHRQIIRIFLISGGQYLLNFFPISYTLSLFSYFFL